MGRAEQLHPADRAARKRSEQEPDPAAPAGHRLPLEMGSLSY